MSDYHSQTIANCNLCPLNCNVDRNSKLGVCKAPDYLKINTYQLHFGEEPVLSGINGSGTIFFSHCNMSCCYCQNYKISAIGAGKKFSTEQFEKIVFTLQEKGAHNINLVSPTPYTSLLIPVLKKIKQKGLIIPVVWNSNAFEKAETLKKLEGLVDIYLPDFRYWDDDTALKYSKVNNYRENAKEAIKEMMRQTGNLIVDEDGIAIFGTMIRLLVLPKNKNNIEKIIQWIYDEFGNETYLSLMSQYYPAYNAKKIEDLSTGITPDEYDYAIHIIEGLGFENGFTQEPATTPEWTPDFESDV